MAIEMLYRGYTFVLMGIVGGISFVMINSFNDCISWDLDLLIQGIMGSAIITSMELIIGISLKMLMLPPMWDYSSMRANYQGVICLPFSLIWVVLSIVGVFLADAIDYYLFHSEQRPYYKLFGKVIFKMPERKCKRA